jgi:hypothetical protein
MSRAHPLRVAGEACNNIAKNHPDFAAQHGAVLGVSPTKCAMH